MVVLGIARRRWWSVLFAYRGLYVYVALLEMCVGFFEVPCGVCVMGMVYVHGERWTDVDWIGEYATGACCWVVAV